LKTLFPAYRVSDRDASLAFYTALGYRVLTTVELDGGVTLSMLKFAEEPAVSLELVHRPAAGPVDPGGFEHLAVQVGDLAAALERLTRAGLNPGPIVRHGETDGPPYTSMLIDPDGYQIELVQWPPGQEDGITEANIDHPG
jgi:lactoylglutathione lyase